MMEQKSGQEPAFPLEFKTFKGSHPNQTTVYHSSNGMSKRFYAACVAMQGILASNNTPEWFSEKSVAKMAYKYADELLKQESDER